MGSHLIFSGTAGGPRGYSSLGRIATMSLAQAVAFYLRVLSFTWIIAISLGLNPWQ